MCDVLVERIIIFANMYYEDLRTCNLRNWRLNPHETMETTNQSKKISSVETPFLTHVKQVEGRHPKTQGWPPSLSQLNDISSISINDIKILATPNPKR